MADLDSLDFAQLKKGANEATKVSRGNLVLERTLVLTSFSLRPQTLNRGICEFIVMTAGESRLSSRFGHRRFLPQRTALIRAYAAAD